VFPKVLCRRDRGVLLVAKTTHSHQTGNAFGNSDCGSVQRADGDARNFREALEDVRQVFLRASELFERNLQVDCLLDIGAHDGADET
jgi:hypothetical protein